MKKTLVAIAALAATGAYAQSTVTIDGIMDANYMNAKAYGQGYSLVNQSGARTTTFKFTGTEDLGGGTKAKFRFEVQPSIIASNNNAFNTTGSDNGAGTVIANGTSQTTSRVAAQPGLVGPGYNFVGVEGNFGEVQLGTINTATLDAFGAGSTFGTGIGSGYNSGFVFGNLTRVETAGAYFTPTMSGFKGRALIGTSNDSQYGSTTGLILRRSATTELGLDFTQGPLKLTFANLKVKTSPNEAAATTAAAAASNVTTTTNTLGASYQLGSLKVGYVIQNQANNAGSDLDSVARKLSTSANMLYTRYDMGASRILLAAGARKTNNGVVTVTSTLADTSLAGLKNTFFGYGLEHDLSKRTFVYLRGSNQTVNDLSFTSVVVNGATLTAMPTDKKISITAVGVSHSF